LWAYIPNNLLPHLQWLASEDYTHVFYVDLKPKVVDAKIFTPDGTHPGGWGTVLIGGMRLGGGTFALSETDVNYDWDGDSSIEAGESKTFRSAYFAFDITDPLNPELLWEFTDANLGFTTSYPAVVHVGTSPFWALAFGTGPTAYDGTSSQVGKTYVVKLATAEQLINSPITTGGAATFMGNPTSVDIDIPSSQCSGGTCSYTPDIFYIGNSDGQVYRIKDIGLWWAGNASLVLDLGGGTKPITAGISVGQDDNERLWLYFGTGKLLTESDQTNTDDQALVGVKEPTDFGSPRPNFTYATVAAANLLNTTAYTVFEGGATDTDGNLGNGTETTFFGLENEIEQGSGDTDYDGWIIDLTGGERCITKPTILGGLVTFSTYLPDVVDICKHEGESYINALYYKTGTASWQNVIGLDDTVSDPGDTTKKKVKRKVCLGYGVASSPSLHLGKNKGAKVIIQTSTGELVEFQEENLPGDYRSRPLNWLEP
jgi:type IV pilus assembly protein PilY1